MIEPIETAKIIQAEMATDLTLAFKLLGSEAMELVSKAEKDGWTIQHLENELMKI